MRARGACFASAPTLLALALLSPSAGAQVRLPLSPRPAAESRAEASVGTGAGTGAEEPRVSQARMDALVRANDRAQLHPGDPLLLVGREQNDNDLRSRTSALARNHGEVPSVDPESNYVRARAMYEDRAVFHRALPAVGGSPGLVEELEVVTDEQVPVPVAAESSAWPLIPIGTILAVFAVWLGLHRRFHPAASLEAGARRRVHIHA